MIGKLGSAVLMADNNNVIYIVPSNVLFATVNINVVNAHTLEGKIKIAISEEAQPTLKDYIEYDCPVASTGVIERTGLILNTGEMISVKSNIDNMVVRVNGIEELA